uniref:Uncharacterized protein n=1 Tax=Oryza barthii TaxID=65489 RepID=A0A0D3FU63_9ORYZ
MMVPLDPSSKPTSQRRIAEGDTVVVYERHDAMRAVAVRPGPCSRTDSASSATTTGSAAPSAARSTAPPPPAAEGLAGARGRAAGSSTSLRPPLSCGRSCSATGRRSSTSPTSASSSPTSSSSPGASCSSPAPGAAPSPRRSPAPSPRTAASAPSISTTRGPPPQGKILRGMA